jgi:hypothetical protein
LFGGAVAFSKSASKRSFLDKAREAALRELLCFYYKKCSFCQLGEAIQFERASSFLEKQKLPIAPPNRVRILKICPQHQ